jgi:hypothetical protein
MRARDAFQHPGGWTEKKPRAALYQFPGKDSDTKKEGFKKVRERRNKKTFGKHEKTQKFREADECIHELALLDFEASFDAAGEESRRVNAAGLRGVD